MGSDKLNEFELISRYFVPLAEGEKGAFALSDDAAVISVASGHSMVVTTDTIVSGVHFLPSDPPDAIARKALAVNLSDLAAMGACPRAYTLSLALPMNWHRDRIESWLDGFASRLALDQGVAGITLVGGDTVASPGPLCVTVTAMGTVRTGAELRRSTARPGDLIYVSGTIGDAALGLRYIQGELSTLPADLGNWLADRYRFPGARTELGRHLSEIARGVADVSDGLVADIEHVCVASNVTASIEASLVPLSLPAKIAIDADPDLLALVLTGGDDYELVFSVSPELADGIQAISQKLDVPLTAIGHVDKRSPTGAPARVSVVGANGCSMNLRSQGYRHF